MRIGLSAFNTFISLLFVCLLMLSKIQVSHKASPTVTTYIRDFFQGGYLTFVLRTCVRGIGLMQTILYWSNHGLVRFTSDTILTHLITIQRPNPGLSTLRALRVMWLVLESIWFSFEFWDWQSSIFRYQNCLQILRHAAAVPPVHLQ